MTAKDILTMSGTLASLKNKAHFVSGRSYYTLSTGNLSPVYLRVLLKTKTREVKTLTLLPT